MFVRPGDDDDAAGASGTLVPLRRLETGRTRFRCRRERPRRLALLQRRSGQVRAVEEERRGGVMVVGEAVAQVAPRAKRHRGQEHGRRGKGKCGEWWEGEGERWVGMAIDLLRNDGGEV